MGRISSKPYKGSHVQKSAMKTARAEKLVEFQNAPRKAYDSLMHQIDGTKYPSQDVIASSVASLFPREMLHTLQLIPVARASAPHVSALTGDDIFQLIARSNGATAAGPSSISNDYLKKIRKDHWTQNVLAEAFNQLINNPSSILQCPELFQFRLILIPKPNGSFRPIAIQEAFLNLLSTHLCDHLRKKMHLSDF